MRLTHALIPATALALAACGSAGAPDTTNTAAADMSMPAEETMPMDGASAEPAADAAMPTTAQGFADAASATDQFELESSKLAQTMGKSAAVKEFAAMMIKDHTKSTADLKAAAAKASPAVTPAAKMTAMQESDLAALKKAGDRFDALYGQKQAAGHEKALAMLQGYAANGDSAPLKEFAGKTAPVVSSHLDMARKLPQ